MRALYMFYIYYSNFNITDIRNIYPKNLIERQNNFKLIFNINYFKCLSQCDNETKVITTRNSTKMNPGANVLINKNNNWY